MAVEQKKKLTSIYLSLNNISIIFLLFLKIVWKRKFKTNHVQILTIDDEVVVLNYFLVNGTLKLRIKSINKINW